MKRRAREQCDILQQQQQIKKKNSSRFRESIEWPLERSLVAFFFVVSAGGCWPELSTRKIYIQCGVKCVVQISRPRCIHVRYSISVIMRRLHVVFFYLFSSILFFMSASFFLRFFCFVFGSVGKISRGPIEKILNGMATLDIFR